MIVHSTEHADPTDANRFLSLTLLRLHIDTADELVKRILARIGQDKMVRSIRPLDIYSVYNTAPPSGGAHLYKMVIYEPVSSPQTTVLIVNLIDGWNSLADLLAKEHYSVQAHVISTERQAPYAQHSFRTWSNGHEDRLVMLMRDSDRWKFFQRGKPKFFEDESRYISRDIRTRLNRSMLLDFTMHLGWDVRSPGFWASSPHWK